MKKFNGNKFNIFIAVLIPLLIILTITTTFLIQNLISYITYKNNTINTSSNSFKNINMNEVPYISTYYIEPKISPKKDVIIDYYVTDYYHKEYTEEDTSEIFTITVKISGQKDAIKKNVKAELEKIASTITPSSNTYTCVIADTVGNGEPGNWWDETIVKYADDYNKDAVMQESTNTRIGLQQLLDGISAEGYSSIKLVLV